MVNLHDARLQGLRLNADKSASLEFALVTGQARLGKLVAVENFLAKNFREGNIVLDVEFYKGCEASSIDLKSYLGELLGFSDSLPVSSAKAIEEKVSIVAAAIAAGKQGLFLLSSSYGCEIIAVCKEFILVDD